jgi:hypothetical protein
MGDDLLKQLATWGPGGVVLVLLILGVLVTKRELTGAQQDGERWRQMFEQEREAHRLTQEALARERERMDAALEAGRTSAMLLQYLGHQAAPVTPPVASPPITTGSGSQ